MKNKENDIDDKLEALCHPEHILDDIYEDIDDIDEKTAEKVLKLIQCYMRVVVENYDEYIAE